MAKYFMSIKRIKMRSHFQVTLDAILRIFRFTYFLNFIQAIKCFTRTQNNGCIIDDGKYNFSCPQSYKNCTKRSEISQSTSEMYDMACLEDDLNRSLPEIEILRCDSDAEDEEMQLLETELEAKKINLKNRRHELCDKLLAYKLMEFSVSLDILPMRQTPPKPASKQFEFKSPYPVAAEERPQTPAPNLPPIAALFNENELSYSTEQEQIDLAIKLSIQDMEKVHALLDESLDTGLSARIESLDQSQPPNDLCQDPNDPDINPQLNLSIHDSSGNLDQQPGGNLEDESTVGEWEGSRYVGDKGKRPLSGKYSYKKRAKTIQPHSEEQSGSGPPPSHSEQQPQETEFSEEDRTAE